MPVEQLAASKPMTSPARIFEANADALADTYRPFLSWEKPTVIISPKAANSPKLEALADLVHALINSNEFFYLP